MKSLADEINRIITSVDPTWTDLEKTRYVYIEVGKMIEKHAEWFLTKAGKLEKNALSDKDMIDILYGDEIIFENKEWYRVICKSGGVIIKTILDKLNIPCHLVKTTSYSNLTPTNRKRVYHWFLSVDTNNTHYLLTIASDLHNIKNNFSTEHFGTYIRYQNDEGNQQYEGEKIDWTTISPEELFEIDKKIGYINTFFNYKNGREFKIDYNNQALRMLNNILCDNKWYHEIIIHNLPIYKNMFSIIDGNGLSSNITTLDNKTIFCEYHNQLIKSVCLEVERNLKEILDINIPTLKFQDFDNWIKNMCELLQDDLIDTYGEKNRYLITIPNKFDFKDWRKAQKKQIHCPYKFYDDYLLLLDQVYSYVGIINELHKAYISGNVNEKDIRKIRNLRTLHSRICEHFLPDISIIEKNLEVINKKPYVKSNYINEKFKTIFPLVFNVNEGPQDFNSLGYSEQIATINAVIPNFFDELNENNCSQIPNYIKHLHPSLNRIRVYTLFNEETKNYELIFHIPSFFDFEDEYYYKYKLKENTFSQVDIIEDVYNQKKYEIVSITLKNKLRNIKRKDRRFVQTIEELENIESHKAL